MVEISILNQRIDDEDGVYRVRFGDKVGYITIATDVFDDYTLCRPHLMSTMTVDFKTTGVSYRRVDQDVHHTSQRRRKYQSHHYQ